VFRYWHSPESIEKYHVKNEMAKCQSIVPTCCGGFSSYNEIIEEIRTNLFPTSSQN